MTILGTSTGWISHEGVLKSTHDAVLFDIGDEEVWVPKSQIVDQDDDTVGINLWWLRKKRMQYLVEWQT